MWWSEMRLGVSRLVRLAAPLVAAGLLAGCFQPLYGERSIGGGPSIKAAFGSVDVRNNLLFALNANSKPIDPAYRLNIRMSSTRLTVIVDLTSARPELENYGLNVTYNLVEAKTGRVVINDVTFARVSYDIPGQAQRFAQARGLRAAENRAGQVIVEHIKNRLASYFVAGT